MGCFHPESSAQQSFHPRLPSTSYETSATFTHAPLNHPRNIRILHLKNSLCGESEDWKDQVLDGTLVDNSLDDVPLYLALSYAWGDPSLSDVILIDKQELKITQSSGAALRRMLKDKSEIMIWIDAICINQAGDTQAIQERNAQVALMDEIYSKATQVNVHLGEGDKRTDEACKAVKRLAAACTAALAAEGTRVEEKRRRWYDYVAEEVLQHSPGFTYGKLQPLFRLPWFRRLWVFQEIVLGRKVAFYCGEHIFSLENLMYAADLELVPYSKLDATARYWVKYIASHRLVIYYLQQQEQGKDAEIEFISILQVARDLNATRPEDQIYGLYGCAKRLGLDWPTPDYTKSVAQVYTDAVVACFRKDKELGIIMGAVGPAVGELGLPSWVPDFSGSFDTPSLLKPPELVAGSATAKQCSGASRCEWNFIPDGRHLKVKGRRFDYIEAVGETWRTLPPMRQTEDNTVFEVRVQNSKRFVNCIGSWIEVVLQRNKIRDSSTNLADDSVAISDLADFVANANPHIPESLDRIIENITLVITSTRKSDVDLRKSVIDRDNDNYRTIREFTTNMSLFAWKLVFRTTNQLCMGISNYNATAGDLLVIFHGMKSPCLIRPCAEGFNFIGEAFVEGTLNGEFWKGGSDENDEWFTLI